jgi:hypothetical protein
LSEILPEGFPESLAGTSLELPLEYSTEMAARLTLDPFQHHQRLSCMAVASSSCI